MKIKKHLSFTSLRRGLSNIFNAIPDARQQSKTTISLHDGLMSGFAMMYFQDPSLLQFQQRMQKDQHRNNLQTFYGVSNIPKATQLRDITDGVDSELLSQALKDAYLRLQRGKHLKQFELFPGLYFCPMDGTEYFSSQTINCNQCLTKTHRKGFELYVYSEMPLSLPEKSGCCYYLIGEPDDWQLCHVSEGVETAIELSEVEGLTGLLNNLTLETLFTKKGQKRIKTKLTPYHDKTFGSDIITYSHSAIQGGIMHPDMSVVIPFMPEKIANGDGASKQDCETNAGKRFVVRTCDDHPQLGLIFGGDSLYSRQPHIEGILNRQQHYLFVAKPTDHKYLMNYIDEVTLKTKSIVDDKGNTHLYEWINDVPLNGRKDSIQTNFIRYTVTSEGAKKAKYQSSWVTDLPLTESNIEIMVRAGRCRWKAENECFNTLKNQGYCLDHNYGHGDKNLCFNFYLLTLLAFFWHQIFELTDELYKEARKKFGSKQHLWETLRSYIKIIIFDTWEALLQFALDPPEYKYSYQPP